MGNSAQKKRNADRKLQKRARPNESSSCPVSIGDAQNTATGNSATDEAKATKPKPRKESTAPPAAVRRSARSRVAHTSQLSHIELHAEALPISTTEPVKEPLKEPTSRPKRKAKTAFENRLAEIVEEEQGADAQPAEDGDRNIGGYQFEEEEWQKWERLWEEQKIERENDFDEIGDEMEDQRDWEDSGWGSENPSAQTITSSISKQAKAPSKPLKSSKVVKPSKKRCRSPSDNGDNSEEDEPPFTVSFDVASKSKDICDVLSLSSKTNWTNVHGQIARILNVHPDHLQAQYTLSSDRKDAIPMSLTSESHYTSLISRIDTLTHPGYTAAGKLSKKKRKVITVFVTHKGDEGGSSGNDGQKQSRSRSSSQKPDSRLGSTFSDGRWREKVETREAIKAYWKCDQHSSESKISACWINKEGINANRCYVLTEQDINWWAEEIMKDPVENTIEKKPEKLILFNMRANARTAVANGQPQSQMQMPFGMFGGGGQYGFPGFMQMPQWGMVAPPTAPTIAPVNPNPPNAQLPPPANSEIIFPDVSTWVDHCEADERRARMGKMGELRGELAAKGYFEIDQLTGDRVSQVDLAHALNIGLGRAALIIKWAEEDVAKVRAGSFVLNRAL